MSGRLVLVTGATGFLGAEVVRRLVARGDEVHALARAGSDRGPLAGVAVTWHVGDLTDRASLERACWRTAERAFGSRRAWDLIHAGALISYRTQDRATSQAVNVDGTRHVLEAARGSGVARVVHVSSVVAVGACTGRDDVLDETSDFNLADCGVAYVTTKRAAEELALSAARDVDLVVVNPGAIFGPVERRSNTARFLRQVALGKGPIAAPPGTISVLGIEDAAEGTIGALDRGRRGERYLLVESWIRTRDLFRLAAEILGRRGPAFTVPRAAWPVLLPIARALDRVRPMDLAPPEGLVLLARDLRFDASKARRELGFAPRPFVEVLTGTIESLRSRGLLDAEPPARERTHARP